MAYLGADSGASVKNTQHQLQHDVKQISPCSLRRWNRGEPNRLFLKELRRVLQWAELLAAMPLPPPGLEGGVSDSEPTPPPPSAREEDEDEEEEGGVEEGW